MYSVTSISETVDGPMEHCDAVCYECGSDGEDRACGLWCPICGGAGYTEWWQPIAEEDDGED